MTIKLTTTRSIFAVTDPGGWRFKIETDHVPLDGWSACAVVYVQGMKEERAAIEHLRPALRALLRQLDEEFGK